MRLRVASPVLALALVACGEGPAAPPDTLVGAYAWVRSEGGFIGQTRTPATEGYTVRLELDGFGHAGVLTNGFPTVSGRYRLTELPTMGPLPTWEARWMPALPVFSFARFDRNTITFPAPDSLLFSDPCCDGWTHTFSRVRAP